MKLFTKVIISLRNFFSEGHERSVKAKKNIFASFIIKGLSILSGLALVPLTIHYVNPTRYGIWLTLSGIIAWLSFFDIGLGNGLRNKFTEAVALKKNKLARIYISTTYAIIAIIVAVILIFFLVINPFLNWAVILNTPKEMGDELKLIALVVISFFCIRFVLNLITTIIIADQKPAKASLIDFLNSLISLIFIFILTKTTVGSLLNLAILLSGIPVIVLIAATWWFFSKEYKNFIPSFKYIKFRYAKNLLSLGAKFFVIQISFLVIYETNNIIISQLFGPAQVTTYNIAFKYFSLITMAFSIIMAPFWSAITDAYTSDDTIWIKNIMKKLQWVWVVMLILTVIMLGCANSIYKIWIGDSVNVPFGLSLVVAIYIIVNSWCAIYSQFLNGVGKIKLQLYIAVSGAILDIPFAIFLGKIYGISGVILANVILVVLSAAWLPIQYYKIVNKTDCGIWTK